MDKTLQLKALREMLDGIYVDAEKSHSEGTVPCDLTIIFTAIASQAVSLENLRDDFGDIKEDLCKMSSELSGLNTRLGTFATEIKVRDGINRGRREVLVALMGGGLGAGSLFILNWLADHWTSIGKLI